MDDEAGINLNLMGAGKSRLLDLPPEDLFYGRREVAYELCEAASGKGECKCRTLKIDPTCTISPEHCEKFEGIREVASAAVAMGASPPKGIDVLIMEIADVLSCQLENPEDRYEISVRVVQAVMQKIPPQLSADTTLAARGLVRLPGHPGLWAVKEVRRDSGPHGTSGTATLLLAAPEESA